MLTFDDVLIERDGTARLGPVSLELDPSRRTVILGHNGAGKSLFLRVAHGLLAPDRGTVQWGSQSAKDSRRRRGFVFQATPVMRRSVAANVEFPLIAQGIGRADRGARVKAVLSQAALENWHDNPAATLSGGEKQRLAIARALVTQPATILLDEPAASLDPASTERLEALILGAHASGTGIIMSTHDLGQAKRVAQDVLLFDAGIPLLHVPVEDFFAENGPEPALGYRRQHSF